MGQMLSHHSSFNMHLHHSGGLETGLHLLRTKRYNHYFLSSTTEITDKNEHQRIRRTQNNKDLWSIHLT